MTEDTQFFPGYAAAAAPIQAERIVTLHGTRERVWKLLSDTDHGNRHAGNPPITFSAPQGGTEGLYRLVHARVLGIKLVWKESPYDYVEPVRLDAWREYLNGPVSRGRLRVEILPGEGPVRVRLATSFWARRPAVAFLARGVANAVVGGLSRYLVEGGREWAHGNPHVTPAAAKPPRVNAVRLAEAARAARTAGVPGPILDRLTGHLRSRTDDEVVHMRPFALADAWGRDRQEVLAAFLRATRSGLLTLSWELICPNCRVVKASHDSLRNLAPKFHCDVCRIDYEAELDRAVELRFSVHPDVRHARDDVTFCIQSPQRSPHIHAQVYLLPGMERTLTIDLPARAMRVRTIGPNTATLLRPRPGGGRVLRLALGSGGWMPHGPAPFAPGPVRMTFRNTSGHAAAVVVEEEAWSETAATALLVSTMQEFRDLFSSEVLSPHHRVGVRNIALLFSDLKGSTAMYNAIGDAPAFGLVSGHLVYLAERVRRHGGAVVKTIGDAIMAAFPARSQAVAAALSMQRDLAAFNRGRTSGPPLVLKLGVFEGPAIASTPTTCSTTSAPP